MLGGWDSRNITIGNVTTVALLDEMDVLDVDRVGDPVLVRKSVLKVARGLFTDALGVLTVARGDTATIDGTAYTVADVRVGGGDGRGGGEELDGRELHLLVRKV